MMYLVTISGDDHEVLHEVEIEADSPGNAETNALDSFISNLDTTVEAVGA